MSFSSRASPPAISPRARAFSICAARAWVEGAPASASPRSPPERLLLSTADAVIAASTQAASISSAEKSRTSVSAR